MTSTDTTSYKEAYKGFYEEALPKPMPWFPLDSDFLRDVKVRRLAIYGGWRYIALYIDLIAVLASTDNHIYDLSDEMGWTFLLSDMSVAGCELDEDSLREFVGVLLKLGLVDNGMWDESRKLCSERMLRNAEGHAESVAKGKAKGYRMRRGKEGDRGD